MAKKPDDGRKLVAENRRARFDYLKLVAESNQAQYALQRALGAF